MSATGARRRPAGIAATAEHAPPLRTPVDLRQRLVEDADRRLGFVAREDERRREADGVLARAEDEQAAAERGVDDGVALVRRTLLRRPIAHELDADHQTAPADVSDQAVLVHQRRES